jgi:2-C-methyl-D-erythritol 4-phosphate cytidylyltransferase
MMNNSNNDVAALVPAAGLGKRLGLGPKAFLNLGGSNLLYKVVNTLTSCVGRIFVGVPHDYVDKAHSELADLAEVYPGGASRQDTIFSLFQKCTEQIIVIHDVVRPFASRELVFKVIDGARRHGVAAPFVPTLIPAARYQNGFVTESVPASEAMLPQAPQAFHREILERAYQDALKNGIEEQTTLELVLRLGMKVLAVPGEELNIKITNPLDWEIANKVILPVIEPGETKGGKS